MRLDEFLEKGYKLEAGGMIKYQPDEDVIFITYDIVDECNTSTELDNDYKVIKSAQLEREEQLQAQAEIDKSFEKIDKGNCTFYTHEEMLDKLTQRKEKLSEWGNLIQVNHILPDGSLGESEYYIGRICGVGSAIGINNGSMTTWIGNSDNFVVKVVEAKVKI